MSAEEIVQHLKDHPELIEAPKAELNGKVRFQKNKYRHDPKLEEIKALKNKIRELEAALAAKKTLRARL